MSQSHRKPIYEEESAPITPALASPSSTQAEGSSTPPAPASSAFTLATKSPGSQTPTDQLALQVRNARLFLYRHALAAENQLDAAVSRSLAVEARFTRTIASLKPSPESGEQLLPGSVYVAIAGMGGSILARNRGVFLRATTPLAVGFVAAWSLLPVTMTNISNLVFEWEKRVPGLAETHVQARERVDRFVNTGIAHSSMSRVMLEEKVGSGRRFLEEWLKKGQ